MNENNQPMNLEDATNYAVNAIAQFCTHLQRENNFPAPLIIYALDVNHAMALRITLEASFAALKAEGSEGPKGG